MSQRTPIYIEQVYRTVLHVFKRKKRLKLSRGRWINKAHGLQKYSHQDYLHQ